MRILLVEPYYGGSHRAWADGYRGASRHEIALVTHDARFWKWRMHGAHVTLAERIAREVADGGRPDVVVASSMTNLPALLGAARRRLADPPIVLYMHENQLGYPWSPRDERDASYPMINWGSMTVADLVLFNSDFHLRTWFAAVPTLLGSFPDHRHDHLVEAVRARSEVMPVGVDLARLDGAAIRDHPPLLLWNHRGEHDKGPDVLAAAVLALARHGVAFRLALAGERFVSDPPEFADVRAALGTAVVHDGFAADSVYVALLRSADIVVSTARQEYFGVAVTEAIYAGAFPVLPHGSVYPERIPAAFHGRCLWHDEADLVQKLRWAIEHPTERASIAAQLRPVMSAFDWSVVAPRYDARLASLISGR